MGEWLSRQSAQDQSKYSLYPTRTRNLSTWLLCMYAPLLYLIKHDCDKTWEKHLAAIGRSGALYLGMYFDYGIHSPGCVIEVSNINRLCKISLHKNETTPFPLWGHIPKWQPDYTNGNRKNLPWGLRPQVSYDRRSYRKEVWLGEIT